jgi:hypothetical protein
VGLLAVALARDPDFEPETAARKLIKAAAGNRTAILRSLARLQPSDGQQPGPIGIRAADAMRKALEIMAEEDPSLRRNRPASEFDTFWP